MAVAFANAAAFAADDSPLRIRNIAPASGIYGEPCALGGDVLASGYELTFDAEVANNFTSNASGSTLAFFDGETTYLTYGFRRAIAERFEWGIELPWVVQDGGYFDHSIQDFHSIFGFPNNGRREAKLNKIDYFVSDKNKVYVDFQDPKNGWGDARVSAKPVMRGKRSIYLPLRHKFQPVPVYDRYSLKPGTRIAGPVILEERESTLVVPVAASVKILADYTVAVTIREFT